MPSIQNRFGRPITAPEELMDFGEWGALETLLVFDAFIDAHQYFDSEVAIKDHKKRVTTIEAARKYYSGNHKKPLKIGKDKIDNNVLINLCRPLIDDSVSWLFGHPDRGRMEFEIEDVEVSQEPEIPEVGEESITSDSALEAQAILEAAYERSGGFHFFKTMGVRGGVAGHAFTKIVASVGDEPPKVVNLDPTLCSVWVNPGDVDEVLAYSIEWVRQEAWEGIKKQSVIYRQLAVAVKVKAQDEDGNLIEPLSEEDGWVVGNFKAKQKKKREWFLLEDDGPWAWPYQWSPILDAPNLNAPWGFYGLSDLEDVAGVNDAINFVASNIQRIIKHHAYPKTVGTGFSANDLVESSVSSFWTIPNPEAKIVNLEMRGDLGAAFSMLDLLATDFWSMGRGLDPAVFKDKIGQVTNFGLRVLANRAIHKMEDKRLNYGKMIRETNRRILEMMKRPGLESSIKWPEPLPEDPTERLKRAQLEIDLGTVSRQTISQEFGRNWTIEQPRIEEEKRSRVEFADFLFNESRKNAPSDNSADRLKAKQNNEDEDEDEDE